MFSITTVAFCCLSLPVQELIGALKWAPVQEQVQENLDALLIGHFHRCNY